MGALPGSVPMQSWWKQRARFRRFILKVLSLWNVVSFTLISDNL